MTKNYNGIPVAALIWQSASDSKYGIAVKTDDFVAAKNLLNYHRHQLAKGTLKGFVIRQSPNDPLELWIIKSNEESPLPVTVNARGRPRTRR